MDWTQSIVSEGDAVCGFVGIDETWKFLKPTTSFILPRSVDVTELEDANFLGMTSFGVGRKAIRIHLGEYCEHVLWQIITLPRLNQVGVTTVSKLFVCAVDDSLEVLKREDGWAGWRSECCSTYAEALACANCLNDFSIEIGMEFVSAFGGILNACIHQRLFGLHFEYKTFTAAHVFNQISTTSLDDIFNNHYNHEEFSELAIFFCREYSKLGHALFWDREDVVRYMSVDPDEEWYPAMIHGSGGYRFNKMSETEDGVRIFNVKFYNDICKVEYEKTEEIFGAPLFADFIAGQNDVLYKKNKMPELRWVNTVGYIVGQFFHKEKLPVKCEAMISVMKPGNDAPQKLKAIFDSTFGEKTKKFIRNYCMKETCTYLSNVLLPPYYTLNNLVRQKSACLYANNDYIPRFDDLKLASVCEALLCFAVQGTCFTSGGKPMHPEKLLSDFGLLNFNFYKRTSILEPPTLPNLAIDENRIRILDYSKVPLFIENIFYNTSPENHMLIEKSLISMKNETDIEGSSENIANCFWLALKEHVIDVFLDESQQVRTLAEIADRIGNRNVQPKSVREFFDFLLASNIPDLKLRTQFLKPIQNELTPAQFVRFREICSLYIENELYEIPSMLLFLVKSESFYLAVLPFRKTPQFSFETMNLRDRDTLFKHYENVYDNLYNDRYRDYISDYLIEFQNENDEQTFILADVFSRINQRCREADAAEEGTDENQDEMVLDNDDMIMDHNEISDNEMLAEIGGQ